MRYWQIIPRPFITSLHILLLLSLTWNILPISSLDCAKAKRDWLTYRYKVLVTGIAPTSYNQPVCPIPDGSSCCDKQMEMDLFAVGERELSTSLANWLIPVAEQMESDSVALDYFFRSDLTEARNRLHEAFSGIYGYNYKVNHAFFFQFFNDLEAYMAGRRGDVAQLVLSFFAQLRTSIVVLMEKAEVATGGIGSAGGASSGSSAPTGGAPDTQRINCLSEALGKQNAFDLTDLHLKEQFLQVYPPARMLVNSLAATSKLLRTVVEDASKRPECIAAFSRFRYCGIYCGGREGPQAEICPAACDNFIKACFVDAASSDPSNSLPNVWSQLISAITTTTKRLERTQNFASVNKDLHIFLSEAITYVHQKYATVKPSLTKECKYTSGSSSSGNTAGGYKPSANSWPFSSRLRRALVNSTLDTKPILSRAKRQGSYPGAAWQQPDTQSSWGAPPTPLGNQMSPSQLHGSYQSYFHPGRRGGNSGGLGGDNTGLSANAPEKLNKWASQLKFYYSGVQELFNRAPPSVCAATLQPNSACWNPQPVSPSSQSKRYISAISDLHALTGRLDIMNSQNNGDPEALELGARVLAEVKMRNTSSSSSSSAAAANSPRGGPSLLQSMGPSPAGQMYAQPSVRSHDPWRTGAAVNNFIPPQPIMPPPVAGDSAASPYTPGSPYQMPPTSRVGGGPGHLPNSLDMDAAESGAGGASAPETQSGIPQPQPGYAPSPPRQPGYPISPQQPPDFSATGAEPAHPPNQLWGGPPGDTEGSGFGDPNPGAGSSGTWSQGSPWQQPAPPSSNPWETHPQPQPQPHPVKPQPSPDGNNYQWPPNNFFPDQQQGSGDGVLSGPEAYPPPELPPVVEIAPTPTTTLALPTTATTILPTTTSSTSTTTISTTTTTTTTSTTTTTTTTSAPVTERGKYVNESLPRPLSQSIGGIDDEDFEQPTQTLPHQPPGVTQRPWNPQQPGQHSGPEASGQFPDSQETSNQGGMPPLGPLSPSGQVPEGPPDCSPGATASAGSGVDPRCLPGGAPPEGSMPYPGQPGVAQPHPPDWSSPGSLDLEGEGGRGGSGMAPDDVLEPPPPPHQIPSQPYPGYSPPGESSHGQPPDFPGLPGFERLVPPQPSAQLPTTDLNRPYHQPTKKPPLLQQPSSTAPAPARELPPDIWLPVPELKPGDPRLPDSKLFLPDFPPHRGRPMLSERTSSATSLSGKAPFFSFVLPLLILLVDANLRG